jgi:hypothetical protein
MVDGPREITPFAMDFDVGLIDIPACAWCLLRNWFFSKGANRA